MSDNSLIGLWRPMSCFFWNKYIILSLGTRRLIRSCTCQRQVSCNAEATMPETSLGISNVEDTHVTCAHITKSHRKGRKKRHCAFNQTYMRHSQEREASLLTCDSYFAVFMQRLCALAAEKILICELPRRLRKVLQKNTSRLQVMVAK